uniref:Uncharacterized protein n=1 Tax=Fagus sylvatica TaxID=28930 RepID=A0A2N9GEB2_FAGSY
MEGENAFVLVNNPPPNPSGTRRVMSEVRVEANRERVEDQRGRSHATRDVIDAEALKRSRKIERLERELRELKETIRRAPQSPERFQAEQNREEDGKKVPCAYTGEKRSESGLEPVATDLPFPFLLRELSGRNSRLGLLPSTWSLTMGRQTPCRTLSGLIGLTTDPSILGRSSLRPLPPALSPTQENQKEVDSLMALVMRSGESLKSYSARYWETYNEIDRCGEDVAISQFRFGLPVGSKLRQSLAKKPPPDMSNLMSRIEQHVRVEEDGLQPQKQSGDNVVVQKKSAQPETSRAQRNPKQSGPVTRESFQAINTTFKEPIFKILPQIKNKPYFAWPARLNGDPASRESMPYCAYHRERGHLTETCRNYKALLEELVRDGHLHQFVDNTKLQQQRVHNPKPKAPIGTIDVIHSHARADSLRTETREAAHLREVFQVSEGIGDFEVKRILIDPGSSAEIIPWLHKMKAVPSTLHQRLRFPTPEGIMELEERAENEGLAPQKKCAEELERHYMSASDQERYFLLGASLSQELRDGLTVLLMEYSDVFAWSPYEAPGVDPAFACHSLNVDPLIRPVVQKGRRISPLHQEAVCEEVNRLVEAKAIREILYPTWLSNTVVVKKKNGKWRVCIDFTDLNKACPKDPFPLPKIDQLVDATSGHQRMSFLDAFQGYHQIAMNPADEEKTAFITPRGIFCYKVMPFGLKNAGATYQRMITKMFSSQLGKTVEVYIDDMVVKSVRAEDHLEDLRAVFNTLRRHRLKLNASKCAFGVGSGKFLGFMVTQRAEKCRPFFDLIKKGKNFHWGEQSDQAFERLKEYLSAAPLLSTPVNGESLYVYLAVSEHAVSAAIVREDCNVQKPVYYTSKTLDGAESRYLPLEKLAFALVCSSKKLPHYFQAHTMIVLTEQPLKAVLRSADFSGRISKWGAQLGAYDINYRPRTSIKGQVLADFIAEFTPAEMGPMWVNHISSVQRMEGWKLYIDGASNSRGSGLGVVLTAPQGQMMELAIRLGFPASNNLVVNQISGDYAAKDEKMRIYLVEAKKLLAKFKHVQIEHIGRELNGHADALAGLASAVAPELRRIISVGVQSLPSIGSNTTNEVCSVVQSSSWMSPILAYLKDDILPTDRKEADRIRRIAPRYWVSKEGNLYRRSFTGPYLRCVHPDTVQNLLWEIHEGVCGGHTGGRSLAHRAIGQGYWWPYMQKDAAQYVKQCDKCQRFAPSIHQPAASLNPIASPWPFFPVGTGYSWTPPPGSGKPPMAYCGNRLFYQFTSGPFREFCEQYGIRNHFSTPAYPQANGQAESSNKTLLDGIKKRLENAKGRWVEELPSILWTYRTTPRCSTGETPFSLTYGVEAVIPLEVGLPTIRTEYYDPVTNEAKSSHRTWI